MQKICLFSFIILLFSFFEVMASNTDDRVGSDDNVAIVHMHETPFPGTEVIVTLTNQKNIEAIVKKATEVTGLPIFFVREMDENHAVFAIDQFRLLKIIQRRLFDHGALVLELPSPGPKVMGREPVPRISVGLSPETTPDLWAAKLSADNSDANWKLKKDKYMKLSDQITEITRIPVNSYSGTEDGWIFVTPAVEKCLEILSSGLVSASEGGSVEFIRLVKPFKP